MSFPQTRNLTHAEIKVDSSQGAEFYQRFLNVATILLFSFIPN